jgi:hypothetical protein
MQRRVMEVKSDEFVKNPFFARTRTLRERIDSLDDTWYVEFWDVHYYFIGIEVYSTKKEIVKQKGKNNRNGMKIK